MTGSVSVLLVDDSQQRRAAVRSLTGSEDMARRNGNSNGSSSCTQCGSNRAAVMDVFLHVDDGPANAPSGSSSALAWDGQEPRAKPEVVALHRVNEALAEVGTSVRVDTLQFATVFPLHLPDKGSGDGGSSHTSTPSPTSSGHRCFDCQRATSKGTPVIANGKGQLKRGNSIHSINSDAIGRRERANSKSKGGSKNTLAQGPSPQPPSSLLSPSAASSSSLAAASSVLSPSSLSSTSSSSPSLPCSAAPPSQTHFDWVFFAVLKPNELDDVARSCNRCHQELALLPESRLSSYGYELACTPWLARVLRTYHPLVEGLQKHAKRNVPSFSSPFDELLDYHLVDPCLYVFDNPGKGVRSKSVRALSEVFAIHPSDLKSLMESVDRFHELSLVIDDIEDRSTLRRDRLCAHLKFGIPATLNSAYFLTFKLIDNVPRLFRRHHDETTRLLVDGTVRAHRGQGLEIHWRENQYCPTEAEYIDMVKGKTSTPFVLSCQLFFLHSTDWRVRASRVLVRLAIAACRQLGLGKQADAWLDPYDIEVRVTALFESVGVFFQVRDDYINLTDPAYWRKKGFCDDIHEKKFSFPIVYMVQHKLHGFSHILQLFYSEEDPSFDDISAALSTIQQTRALDYTYEYLVRLRGDIVAEAQRLDIRALLALLDRLTFPPPYPAPSQDVIEGFRPTDSGCSSACS